MIPPFDGWRYRGPGVAPGAWRTSRKAAAEDALAKALAHRHDLSRIDPETKAKLWKSLRSKGWRLEHSGEA